jgi:DNA primase
LKKVAAELRARFFPEDAKQNGRKPAEPETRQLELDAVVNAPLDFELQGLDPAHPYLLGRGFTKETIAQFQLGYCSRGYLKGRIAIPLHDHQGRLIGYAGRIVDDASITEENPRYRLPTKRERDGKVLDFRTSMFLYNGHRVEEGIAELIVVSGFSATWWLSQHGFSNVVATVAPDCSDEQARLLVSLLAPAGRLWVLASGGNPGEQLAHSIIAKVSPHRFVRWAKLEQGEQPTALTADGLKAYLTP